MRWLLLKIIEKEQEKKLVLPCFTVNDRIPVDIEVVDYYFDDHLDNLGNAIIYNMATVAGAEKVSEIIDQASMCVNLPPCGEYISAGAQVLTELYDKHFDSELHKIRTTTIVVRYTYNTDFYLIARYSYDHAIDECSSHYNGIRGTMNLYHNGVKGSLKNYILR